jgi:hypothetical protein
MKSKGKYPLVATYLATTLLTAITCSMATAAAAPTITHYRSGGLAAEFEFSSTSGSIQTSVYVYGARGTAQTSGLVSVVIDQYDSISGNDSYYVGEVTPTTSQFTIDNSLQSASLDIPGLIVQDLFGNSTEVDILLTWTGSGGQPSAISRSDETFRTVVPGSGIFNSRYHSTGLTRSATAAGTLLLNGANLLANVPDYSYADLSRGSIAEIDITKPF